MNGADARPVVGLFGAFDTGELGEVALRVLAIGQGREGMSPRHRILAESALGLGGDEVEDAIEFECVEVGLCGCHCAMLNVEC